MAIRGDAGIQLRERRIHTVREGHLPQSQEAGRLGYLGLGHMTKPEGNIPDQETLADRSVLGFFFKRKYIFY